MRDLRGKLTYANVMSTIAVFLALGGGSFAIAAALKKDSVKSKQVKDNSLLSKDLKDGKAVTAADVAAPEPFHVIGDPGEPPFGDGGDGDCIWSDPLSGGGLQPPSFYKDATGRVHLSGAVSSANGTLGDDLCDSSGGIDEIVQDFRVFTLPPGYQPDQPLYFSIIDSNGDLGQLTIGAEEELSGLDPGAVIAFDPPGDAPLAFDLSAISFRAADANSTIAPRTGARSAGLGALGLPGN